MIQQLKEIYTLFSKKETVYPEIKVRVVVGDMVLEADSFETLQKIMNSSPFKINQDNL